MTFDDKMNKLLQFESGKYPVTSLYLRLGPRDRENFKYEITLKNLVKEARERLNGGDYTKEAIDSAESDLKRITSFVENTAQLSGCRGIAVFSSEGEGIWEVFKLPILYRDRLVIDGSPLVRQLVNIGEEFSDMAVVLIDRKKARLFRIELTGGNEVLDYFYPEATRGTKFRAQEGKFKQKVSPSVGGGEVPHGVGEYGFQRKIENEVQQHLKFVSEKLFEYDKRNKFDWLIVAGSEPVTADFSHHLHTYLKKKLLGSIGLEDINSARIDDVVEKSLELLELAERKSEARTMEEFEEKLHSGFSVNGLGPSLTALMMGQVRVLIVAGGFAHPGFICPESRVLVMENRNDVCPEGKNPDPVVDVVDEAIEEALGEAAEVEIIGDEDLKKRIDGVGAILRFKV